MIKNFMKKNTTDAQNYLWDIKML